MIIIVQILIMPQQILIIQFLTSDGDDSITSSVFGFVCTICSVRAIKQTELIYQYHNDEVFLTDLNNDVWIKCDECGSSFH